MSGLVVPLPHEILGPGSLAVGSKAVLFAQNNHNWTQKMCGATEKHNNNYIKLGAD